MRKIISYILFICIMAPLYVGCYDDKGNYDYIEVTELRIDTAGLGFLPAYAITRFDRLTLAPDIYYNGKLVNEDANAPLEYLWTIYSTATGVGVDYTVDTLGKKRILDAEIARVPNSYIIRLTVTNKENGLQQYLTIPCGIEGSISEGGWMLLYECANNPGYSDVGLVVNSLTKKNIIQDREYWNLYANSNGAPLKGKPVKVMHTVNDLPEDLVILGTDKDMVAINKGTFNKAMGYEQFFREAPTGNKGMTAYMQPSPGAAGEMLITDNKLYYRRGRRFNTQGSQTGYYDVPRIGEYGELAPWLALFHNQFDAVVYDQQQACFMYVPRNGVKLTKFIAQSPDAAFDVNNVDAELIEGDWGTGNNEYLLMKKGSNYYLAQANFFTANNATTNVGKGWYDMNSSPEISKICSMTASNVGYYVIYGAGSSVYNFAYSSGRPAEEIWKAQSADEQVTCVKLQKFEFQTMTIPMGPMGTIMPNPNSVLHIATWNENTQEGKLYQYQINPTGGTIIGEPKIYTVPGKVKSMAWKYVFEMG